MLLLWSVVLAFGCAVAHRVIFVMVLCCYVGLWYAVMLLLCYVVRVVCCCCCCVGVLLLCLFVLRVCVCVSVIM